MSVLAPAPARLRLAEQLLAQGRTDEAEAVLGPASAGDDPAALSVLASLQLAQGRLADAADCARKLLAAGPLPAKTVVLAAGWLARAHDPTEADAALARAIDAGDSSIELRIARARLAEERGRADLALGYWERVLALAGEHLDGRLGLARALRAEGRFADAERLCRELVVSAPKDGRPATELARMAQDAGDPVEAERRWHAALLAMPAQPSALYGLANALAAQHRFAEARTLLAELVAREPRDAALQIGLARMLLAEGDLAAARGQLEALIDLEPTRQEPWLLLARTLEAAGDGGAAATLLRDLLAASPQAIEPRLATAELAARQGDFSAARTQFEHLLAVTPAHLPAHLGLAIVLAELGYGEDAAAVAALAVRLAPNQPRTHLARATVAETLGQLDAARLALLEARSAVPWRVEPLLELAQFALRHGQAAAAAGHGEALLAAHPRHLSARLTAFDTAMAADRHDAARAVLIPLAEELPAHREVQRRLARLDWQDGAVERARSRWARITVHDPRIHGGPDPIERLDTHPLPAAKGEIRAFLLVRNELSRLPWLLDHYRAAGITRFLLLDNGSEDGTRDWLLAQGPDVHLFHTKASFAASGAGMRWTNRLLDEHGCGAWCLTVDADEVLVYPHCERVRLPVLTAHLDAVGAEAMAAPMLDCYAEAPLDAVGYAPGSSLIDAFPWFDATGYVRRDSNDFPFFRLHGGCRARVFHTHASAGPVLQKVPLIRWRPEIKYTSSKHTAYPCRLAEVTGALLHFKYLPEFAAQVREEVARGQHFMGAREYRAYQRRLEQGRSLFLLGPTSARYRGSGQLAELGLVRSSAAFDALVAGRSRA